MDFTTFCISAQNLSCRLRLLILFFFCILFHIVLLSLLSHLKLAQQKGQKSKDVMEILTKVL